MDGSFTHAVRRFGFGSRTTDGPPPADTRQWLASQLDAPDPLLAQPGPTIIRATLADRNYKAMTKTGETHAPGLSDIYQADMTAILQHAVTTDLSVRERLVWFWGNHFTVSARAGGWALGLAGCFLHDAIRPHVTGRFVDMLKAVMLHPAMLWYLDNWLSVGPNSPEGLARHQGLNENLARECLELHTLGVDSGYTQRDVTAFAAILTGRTMDMSGDTPGYVYRPDTHEPGPKSFMGHTVPDGFAGSEAVLEFVASHSATHRHIATQLMRHYVADTPPENCIDHIQKVLKATNGDLKQAILAIFDLPEAWQPSTKFQAPAEYVVSVQRALGLPLEPSARLLNATDDLGQHFMDPILPNGWPDTAPDWIAGEAILKRADWAMTQASRPGAPTADRVMATALGNRCSATTRAAVGRCPNPAEALATVFISPEFLRR
jgi:uncharacterized protein (DUF1800 family)